MLEHYQVYRISDNTIVAEGTCPRGEALWAAERKIPQLRKALAARELKLEVHAASETNKGG